MRAPELRAWERFFQARDKGLSIEAACRKARLSPSQGYRFHRGDPGCSGHEAAAILGINTVAGEPVQQPLCEEARKALDDFAYFRLRYFGRKSMPWQERAAYEVMRLIETGHREYVVMNEPPGSGKSTLFTNDIPCWLIARDRSIRIQIGSRTERQARMYVGRIKKSLERDAPIRTDADSLALGIAFDAHACMQDDFGAFKPEGRSDLWRADALVARQLDGVALDDKEPTVSAWGQDSGFLGGRFDLVIWDDLVDRKNSRHAESKDALREWWATEAETRLEPRGLLILQGQRIAHDDLYRTCLDMRDLEDQVKYRHIRYRAHDDDACKGEHDDGAKAWPDGCLLDPHRLPWKMLQTIKHNNPRTYQVQYQQEDGDLVGGLVQKEWIEGGIDEDGYDAPGCLDRDRDLGDVPAHLKDGAAWSFVTVDPSPTEWWGVIWWLYDPDTQNRTIIEMHRRRMNPEQFLTLDMDSFKFSGLIHDMRNRGNDWGIPISHVVVEVNAAQRWLLQQPHVQRWMQSTGVVFVPHTTHLNKADPKFGVESIGDLFRQGRVRIPFKSVRSRQVANEYVNELTRYPEHDTTDLVMSTWFGKLAVENHWSPQRGLNYRMPAPRWLSGTTRGMARERGLASAR